MGDKGRLSECSVLVMGCFNQLPVTFCWNLFLVVLFGHDDPGCIV